MTLSHMYSLMTSFDNTRDFLLFVFFFGRGRGANDYVGILLSCFKSKHKKQTQTKNTKERFFPVKPYTSVPLVYLLIQVYSCTIDLFDVCKYINI